MQLGSILTAIITPFDADLRVDEDAFVALMHRLAGEGSDGFVVAGTTGEAATLDDEEHLGLIDLAVRERPEGATIDQIVEATGWQKHTVRSAISHALGKKRGYQIVSDKPQGGKRIYKIAEGA